MESEEFWSLLVNNMDLFSMIWERIANESISYIHIFQLHNAFMLFVPSHLCQYIGKLLTSRHIFCTKLSLHEYMIIPSEVTGK